MTAATWDELLEEMLAGDQVILTQAYAEAVRLGWAGFTVEDNACGLLLTLTQLAIHLRRTDTPEHIAARGHRLHTSDNVEFGSLEDSELRGPARRFGA